MLIVGSLTALVPFLGVQATRCLRNYLLNLFEKCPMTVIAGDCDRRSRAESTRESAGDCGW